MEDAVARALRNALRFTVISIEITLSACWLLGCSPTSGVESRAWHQEHLAALGGESLPLLLRGNFGAETCSNAAQSGKNSSRASKGAFDLKTQFLGQYTFAFERFIRLSISGIQIGEFCVPGVFWQRMRYDLDAALSEVTGSQNGNVV
jgi:hypothetical protein